MLPIFLKTLPFFALIGLGFAAGRMRLFTAEATAWLTRFVFLFALSAMLFKFAANLSLGSLFDPRFMLAYLCGSSLVWIIGFCIARARSLPLEQAAMEAHTGMTGNTGFLGVPMLVVLLGQAAAGPVLMVLTMDLLVFTTVITLAVTLARQGSVSPQSLKALGLSILHNPMITSMVAGLLWSALGLPMPQPLEDFTGMLGAAATPGALFAIGASLALRRSAERLGPAAWLSCAKLLLHPLAVGIAALFVFHVPAFPAAVMICAAALPVAGNVYILAHHFQVAENRVSSAILLSTIGSILTVPLVIAWAETQ